MKKFTLVELLVVIAIIGILASMLLPSLQAARAKGLNAVCMSNLKQLQYGYTMYVDDNNENLCKNYSGGVIGIGSTDTQSIINTSLIYNYVGDYRVYKCPSDPVPQSVEANHAIKSYGFNGYLNDNQTYSVTTLGQIDASHNNVMGFVDEAGNVLNGFIRPNADWVGGWHQEAYNISFLDGHVSRINLQSKQSWIVVQDMISSGNRDFSSLGGSNPDRIKLLNFMSVTE